MSGENKPKLYRAALYARCIFVNLAQPDEPNPSTKERIKTLQEYLKDFEDVMITGVYADPRKTKSDHPRPQFHQMIRDVQSGKYDCVVMYSLDTFGKDFFENRFYAQQMFVTMGIRIISMLDHYDSITSEERPGASERLQELVRQNKWFDLSRRISSTKKEAKINGTYPKCNLPYGYIYQPDSESGVAIDPIAAQYVRYIFEQYLSGKKQLEIARELTEIGAPTPSMRKRQVTFEDVKSPGSEHWRWGSITTILRNQMYTGAVTFGTTRAPLYLTREQRIHTQQNDNFVTVPNRHEPIITQEQFDQAQEKLNQESQNFQKRRGNIPMNTSRFANRLRINILCGHCGREMVHIQNQEKGKRYHYYVCSSSNYQLKNPCPPLRFPMDKVLLQIQEAFQKERLFARNLYERLHNQDINSFQKQLDDAYQGSITELLELGKQNTAEILSLSDAEQERKTELEQKGVELRKKLVEAINQKQFARQIISEKNPWIKLFTQLEEDFVINSATVKKYITQIFLYPDSHMVVKFAKEGDRGKLLQCLEKIGWDVTR